MARIRNNFGSNALNRCMSQWSRSAQREASDRDEAVFKELHCLIVDDEPLILLELEDTLRTLGVTRVTRAHSGTTALASLMTVTRPVDCVLCDLNMPDGNGLEVLKAIRTGKIKSSRMDMCFIMITAMADRKLIESAVQLDANGYLVKPVVPDKLRDAILKGRSRHFPVVLSRYTHVPVPHTGL
jgi:CheY-like chemotaxis protein